MFVTFFKNYKGLLSLLVPRKLHRTPNKCFDSPQSSLSQASYAEVKTTTLAVMAKDIALERGDLSSWGSVTFWVDKACIPQDHEDLKAGGMKRLFTSRWPSNGLFLCVWCKAVGRLAFFGSSFFFGGGVVHIYFIYFSACSAFLYKYVWSLAGASALAKTTTA